MSKPIQSAPGEKWRMSVIPKNNELSTHYLVSNQGRVIGIRRNKLIDHHYFRQTEYPTVRLHWHGKKLLFPVHKLVAHAWLAYPNHLKDPVVDHKDGNPKNNRVENLRWVTPRENAANNKRARAGRLTGATFMRDTGRWHARAKIPGTRKNKSLGVYDTEQEAHDAYKRYVESLKN